MPSSWMACLRPLAWFRSGCSPYDGNGVLELNPSLVFPILEMLLGGTGKGSSTIQRDITEIEQKLLDGLFRIILHDLREAWKGVTAVDFTIESMETEPQLLHLLAPNEAVVSIGVEVRIGETVGMMNIAMPSIVIKMMRQKFDQQWSVRKTHANAGEQVRILRMLREGDAHAGGAPGRPHADGRGPAGIKRRSPADLRLPGGAAHGAAGQRHAQVRRPDGEHGKKAGLPGGESAARPAQGKISEEGAGGFGSGRGHVEIQQRIEERAAAAAAVVVDDLEMLQEDQQSQHVGVAGLVDAQTLGFRRAELRDRSCDRPARSGGQGVGRQAFVVQAALQGPMGADRSLHGLAHVEVHRAGGGERRLRQTARPRNIQQFLVLLQELLRDAECPGWAALSASMRRGFSCLCASRRYPQSSGQSTRHLALGAAAEAQMSPRTPGAEAARTAGLANGTSHSPSIKVRGASHDEPDESVLQSRSGARGRTRNRERIGEEIRRHLMKLYGVREAELSNFTTEEE